MMNLCYRQKTNEAIIDGFLLVNKLIGPGLVCTDTRQTVQCEICYRNENILLRYHKPEVIEIVILA
jgi:hypothetical protein